YAFSKKLRERANISYNHSIQKIDLQQKKVYFENGSSQTYSKLINTIPLPEFVLKTNPPEAVSQAALGLSCSEVLLLNFEILHPATRNNQWLYVYDLDKYACRINYTDLLSPNNGEPGKCGIQVEVYFSKYRKQTEQTEIIISKVKKELVEMGLVNNFDSFGDMNHNRIKYANVIFDHHRKKNLEIIFNYLEAYGLKREVDDLEAMTDWDTKWQKTETCGDLLLGGRFGQWNYYWTDDCVLRGKWIAEGLQRINSL
ncbi:MAG TPA: hypothetical protein PKK99_15590, partial [Bacteroidia bacterium]|nr:hypothetical protein [Bacteroidia bacterium]